MPLPKSPSRPSARRIQPFVGARRIVARLAPLTAAVALCLPTAAAAQVPNSDFVQEWGGHVVNAAQFVNVYWASPNTWNSGAAPELSTQVLDAYTKAIIDSSYFGAAANFYVTGVPTFLGSIETACRALPAPGQFPDVPFLSSEVNCALRDPRFDGKPNIVVNLFLPTGVIPHNAGNDPCGTNTYAAFHWGADNISTPFTVIPVDPTCVVPSNLAAISPNLSHEMVEAITSPNGFGWTHNFPFPDPVEVADLCDSRGLFPTASVSFLFNGFVAPYFSDFDVSGRPGASGVACMPLPSAPLQTFDPLQTTFSADHQWLNLKLRGSNFGVGLPARFSSIFGIEADTPYLRLTAQSGGAPRPAGNSLDNGGNLQTVRIDAWSVNEVDASVRADFVRACDTVDLQVWAPSGGFTGHAQSAVLKSPARIVLHVHPTVSTPGRPVEVTGEVLDANGQPVNGVLVMLSGAPFLQSSVPTDLNGTFVTWYTPTASGTITIAATTQDCTGATINATVDIPEQATLPDQDERFAHVAVHSVAGLLSHFVERDTIATFPVPGSSGGSGLGSLVTRTILGADGSAFAKLRSYWFRLDMSKAVAGSKLPCIQTFTVDSGWPLPFDFDNDGVPDDFFVLTSEADGTVAPTSVVMSKNGKTLTVTMASQGVCTPAAKPSSELSFWLGMISDRPPSLSAASTRDNGTIESFQVRAPGP